MRHWRGWSVPSGIVIRFFVTTWGLTIGWGWWLLAPKAAGTRIVGLVVLLAMTAILGGGMTRRSRRLRGDHEYVNARLEYHSGFSRGRWRRTETARGDDGGSEITMGSW